MRSFIGKTLVILSLALLIVILVQVWKIVLGLVIAYGLLLIGGYIINKK